MKHTEYDHLSSQWLNSKATYYVNPKFKMTKFAIPFFSNLKYNSLVTKYFPETTSNKIICKIQILLSHYPPGMFICLLEFCKDLFSSQSRIHIWKIIML